MQKKMQKKVAILPMALQYFRLQTPVHFCAETFTKRLTTTVDVYRNKTSYPGKVWFHWNTWHANTVYKIRPRLYEFDFWTTEDSRAPVGNQFSKILHRHFITCESGQTKPVNHVIWWWTYKVPCVWSIEQISCFACDFPSTQVKICDKEWRRLSDW